MYSMFYNNGRYDKCFVTPDHTFLMMINELEIG